MCEIEQQRADGFLVYKHINKKISIKKQVCFLVKSCFLTVMSIAKLYKERETLGDRNPELCY